MEIFDDGVDIGSEFLVSFFFVVVRIVQMEADNKLGYFLPQGAVLSFFKKTDDFLVPFKLAGFIFEVTFFFFVGE